jgi:hypothetical protein
MRPAPANLWSIALKFLATIAWGPAAPARAENQLAPWFTDGDQAHASESASAPFRSWNAPLADHSPRPPALWLELPFGLSDGKRPFKYGAGSSSSRTSTTAGATNHVCSEGCVSDAAPLKSVNHDLLVDGRDFLATRGQLHHIATDKAIKSGFTKQFERIIGKAGLSLQDPANKVFLQGHAGRHAPAYHRHIPDRLNAATEGLSGPAYRQALETELGVLRQELLWNPDLVRGVGLP